MSLVSNFTRAQSRRILALAFAATAALAGGSAAEAQTKAQLCSDYANIAVIQQQLNIAYGCGAVGARWHQAWATHRNACMRRLPRRSARQYAIRNERLIACGVPPQERPIWAY